MGGVSAPVAARNLVWWLVCCYDCSPNPLASSGATPPIDGVLVPFGHDQGPGDYTQQAVDWVNGHGDATGHTDITMTTNCPVPVSAIPVPRYGVVIVPRPPADTATVKSMRLTRLGADGMPAGDPVHIGGSGTVTFRHQLDFPGVVEEQQGDVT